MPKYEVEVIFHVEAATADDAVRILDTRLDTQYVTRGLPFAEPNSVFTLNGYEILEGAATEVDNVYIEPIGSSHGTHGPFCDEIEASLVMDQLGLSDQTHKIVVREV